MTEIKKIKEKKSILELLEFGIINIDKSSGPTSFNVSDFVKKKLNLRKTSHFGTLDPKVTGVLPVALNRACKLTGYFLGEDKEYVGIMRVHEEISLEKIKEKIKEKFLGVIKQTPPVKSRVKRVEREREIISFEILEQSENKKDYLFKTEVQGGTYIRKLIDDLGKELCSRPHSVIGKDNLPSVKSLCSRPHSVIGKDNLPSVKSLGIGAHMLELRRIRAGIFEEDSIVNLYDFEKAVDEYEKGNEENLRKIIIPAEIISEVYPVLEIKPDNLKKILTGKPIMFEDLKKTPKENIGKIISVFCENKFVGMYKVMNSGEMFAKANFVMQEIKG